MKDAVRSGEAKKDVTRCPYCHESCGPEGVTACPSCEAPHHAECFASNDGCASCAIARDRAPVGTAVPPTDRPAAPPATGQRPLSADVARETLVRAGYSLRDVDALVKPPLEGMHRAGLVLLAATLVVAFLVSGGIATYHGVQHATSHGYGDSPAVAASAGFVALSTLFLFITTVYLLIRPRRPWT